jgi:TPP-dependent trihydroxycyclohexane-1,2-dione (THcHDO) dehydratase
MNDYYPGLPALETVASYSLLFLDTNIQVLRAEKRRRAALPADARTEIEKDGFDKDKDFKTMAEWKDYLTKVKAGVIDQLIAHDSQVRDKTLKTYELTSAREVETLSRVESDAESVIRGDAEPRPDIPSPGKPR